MAFNPFRAFRKRQKTFLAVMAIVCMLLFVAGDVISGRKGNLLGSGKNRDNIVVTKLYGNKITENDIRLAREQHRLGSQFMVMAAGDGMVRLNSQMSDLRKNMAGGSDNITRFMSLQKQSDGLFKTLIRFITQSDDPAHQRQYLQQIGPYLQFLFNNPRPELFESFRSSMQLISLDDTLDYMIWMHQADQLGIHLTESSIEEAVKNLTFDEVDLREVEKSFLARNRENRNQESPLSRDLLYESVGNLLRVNLAKEALMGLPQETSSAFDSSTKGELKETNTLVTPDEFWNYYKKQRTSREIGIMSFSVKNFLDQVKDKPSDKDLEQLFNRFKEDDYFPAYNKPAFKEPRRLSLQWVGARADTAEYKKFADDYVLASVASTPLNPWPAVALAYDFEKDYQDSVKANRIPRYGRMPHQLPDFQFPTFPNEPVLFTSPNEAANLAGTLASMAQGRPWAPLVTYIGAPIAREIQRRTLIAANLVLLGSNPWKLAVANALVHQTPKYVPLSEVGEEATKKLKKMIAQDMVINNLNRLKKELPNLKKEMDEKRAKKESEEEIAKWFAKKLQTEFHVTDNVLMKQPLGGYEMIDDPALKPLKEVYMRLNSKRLEEARDDVKGKVFVDSFFAEGPTYVPKDWPSDMVGGSEATWASEEEPIIYWKTEDKKAYVPTFEAARAKVEKAWRFREARKLARAEAERVAELARDSHGNLQKLRDLALQNKAEFQELRSVALLHKASPSARPDLNATYEPFKFPDSISMPKDNRYGPEEFLTKLAGLMKPGDTVVEGNEPESILFVSTLISKQEPTLASFFDSYRNAKVQAGRDVLMDDWIQRKRQEFRNALMKQLRTEASPDVVDGRFNIDPDIRKRFQTNRDDSGE